MTLVIPGSRIGVNSELINGHGTYSRGNLIYSASVGEALKMDENENHTSADSPERKLKTIIVDRDSHTRHKVPDVGNLILGVINRITANSACVRISAINGQPVSEDFAGLIRKQDVRKMDKDNVVMYKCFRPGDVVLATVISLGDCQSYFLDTTKNENGVIFARSPAGYSMYPISWDEVQCPVTKLIENRKCAKPVLSK